MDDENMLGDISQVGGKQFRSEWPKRNREYCIMEVILTSSFRKGIPVAIFQGKRSTTMTVKIQ
jgi:hypothetical protein